MNYLDEEFLTMQKERLLATYNCETIKEVIEVLEARIKLNEKTKK